MTQTATPTPDANPGPYQEIDGLYFDMGGKTFGPYADEDAAVDAEFRKAERRSSSITFSVRDEQPVRETLSTLSFRPLRDGRLEVLIDQQSKKVDGKRWHTALVMATLTPEQVAELRAALGEAW